MRKIFALTCGIALCAGLTAAEPENYWNFPGPKVRLNGIPDWGKDGFAAEVYLKVEADDCGYALLMPKSFGIPCFRKDGQVRTLLVNTPGKQWSPINQGKAEPGAWVHYILTGTPEKVQVWRNGRPDLFAGINGVPVYERAPLALGESLGWSKQDFTGKIALVRIYNRFVPQKEAEANYALLGENKPLPSPEGLIFEEDRRFDKPGTGETVTISLDNRVRDGVEYPRSRHLAGRTEREKVNFGFEDLTGWKLSYPKGMVDARFTLSREEPLWDNYVGRLELNHGAVKWDPAAEVVLTPPESFMIGEDFNAVNVWAFGTPWKAANRPRLMVSFRLTDADGRPHEFALRSVDQGWPHWDGWSIWHKALPETVKAPARLDGIVFTGTNEPHKVLYLDSLSFYKMSEKMLADARVPSWGELGLPVRPETILPTPVKPSASTLKQTGEKKWQFASPRLTVDVEAAGGTLGDIKAIFNGKTFHPALNGGFYWADGSKLIPPASPLVKAELTSARIDGSRLSLDWLYDVNGSKQPAKWQLELKNNSLVIDLSTANGTAAQVKTGGIHQLAGTVVEVPYMVIRGWRQPSEGPGIFCGDGIYISSLFDWYNSDASALFSECSSRSGGRWEFNQSLGDTTWVADGSPKKKDETASTYLINGGAAYDLKTDGTRNPVRERIFLTIDERFDAVLPNIPNPPHRYLKETAEDVWATRMAYEPRPRQDFFDRELAMWQEMHALGARKLNVRYHGDLFRVYVPRRNGDPITFIEDIEPLIGGDEGLVKLFTGLGALGFRAGLYTDHTLLSPLSYDAWDEDYLTLNVKRDWVYGSSGHHQVKNSRMRNLQKHYNQIFKKKFNPTCSYLDQLTCPPPWRYTDFDARVPGAGMFSAAYRAFVESLRMEIDDFGPVLSEGISQWLFAGICDNYAQTQRADIHVMPDFQLRKIHELSNDCGYHMSLFNFKGSGLKPEENIHKALAYEYAYGNTGHIYGGYHGSPYERAPDYMIKSYFMIQPMQRFYALIPAGRILYNVGGKLAPVEDAVKAGTLDNNQVKVSYANGAETAANLHSKDHFRVQLHDREFLLPPNGFAFYLPGKGLSYSALIDGVRADLTQAGDFFYADNFGAARQAGFLTASEAYIVRPENGLLKVIPAPFRKKETIRLDLSAFPSLKQNHEVTVISQDVHGRALKEEKLPYRKDLELEITGEAFALCLK